MIDIKLEHVLKSKLGFEAYFILICIYSNNEKALINYVTECKKINTNIFKELENDGFINIKSSTSDTIFYELLSLTDKSKTLIESLKLQRDIDDSDSNFEDFRTFYPSSVKDGFKTRRLHGNLKKCRSLYEKLLMETTHDILCKCAKLYVEEKYNSNSQWYIQNLETWLNQKNYIQYVSEASQLNKTNPATTTNDQSEDI